MIKRRGSICMILAVILTLVLEVLTFRTMRYNRLLMIISALSYFVNFLFIGIDAYWTFKRNLSKYDVYSTIRDIAILGAQLPIYYFLGNIKTMEVFEVIIAIGITLIFVFGAIRFAKLAGKNRHFVCTG